ncbi:MAG: three-Cys-motif partner protein TcmP [Bacteroidetes bacterium]|nr:three-Cys-motif partner protein TcmP [Bacteroidota bacterium]MBU1718015.1 three-Cys-motif partner protein TcmP [Bacteroidota bacterium]
MTWNLNLVGEPINDEWGGPWTEIKLETFSKYVEAYLRIMNKNPFWKTIYFDGFAGSGSKEKETKSDLYRQLEISEEEERTYKGAGERVLSLDNSNSFNFYYFIDKEEKSLEKLKAKLQTIIDNSGRTVVFRAGDANMNIKKLAEALRTNEYAALILLDPFGMQIDWDSFKELKNTRSDVWVLVPTGVIVNRLLDKFAKLKHINKLESFFGLSGAEIKAYFYKHEVVQTLFGEEEIVIKVSKPIEKIANLYAKKMKTIWKYVTEEPLRLVNRNGVPIFHFVFASNNPAAVKIANQIIQPK